jgi:hypothetical protein
MPVVGHRRFLKDLGLSSLCIVFVAGCFGNEVTVFPPGLEPLEETTAMAGTAADPYPEMFALVTGETPEYHFAHGHGFVHAPLEDVHAAMIMPDVCTDWRQTDRHVVELDVEPEYDHSFVIHYEVDEFITVEFDVTWRHGIVEGPEAAPTITSATFQKTYGTTFISLMRGSIVARRINDTTTELELVEHISSASGGSDNIAQFLTDFYANVVAVSHGDPLPMY